MSDEQLQIDSSNHHQSLGILLVGHGTRNLEGQQQFKQLFQQFQPLVAPWRAQLAFLELAEPSIKQAVAELARLGVRGVITVPVLLFTAGHAQEDIPGAVREALLEHQMEWMGQTGALECSPEVLELSASRFRQAACDASCAEGCSNKFCSRAGWILIGRGSSSPSATEKTRQFCHLRWRMTPTRFVETAFIHGQHPTVQEAMDDLAAQPCEIVVIQPHLLFSGLLMEQLTAEVAERQRQNPHQRWIITDSLGADSMLAQLLAKRCLDELQKLTVSV